MESVLFDQIDRPKSLAEPMVQRITDAIIEGRIVPGQRLVEAKVANQLGASRGPVREAFQRLEMLGLVHKIPHRGTYVSRLSQQDILELHTIREPLEGLAARLIAEKQDPESITILKDILDRMQLAGHDGQQRRVVELDAEFHDTLIARTDHHLLQEIWKIISLRMRHFLLLKETRSYKNSKEAFDFHQPVMLAILSGEGERADQAARHHVVQAFEVLSVRSSETKDTAS